MPTHGTINEIAKLTHFPPSRLRRLVKSGEIECVKAGVKYVVTVDAVENWLKGNRNAAEAERKA